MPGTVQIPSSQAHSPLDSLTAFLNSIGPYIHRISLPQDLRDQLLRTQRSGKALSLPEVTNIVDVLEKDGGSLLYRASSTTFTHLFFILRNTSYSSTQCRGLFLLLNSLVPSSSAKRLRDPLVAANALSSLQEHKTEIGEHALLGCILPIVEQHEKPVTRKWMGFLALELLLDCPPNVELLLSAPGELRSKLRVIVREEKNPSLRYISARIIREMHLREGSANINAPPRSFPRNLASSEDDIFLTQQQWELSFRDRQRQLEQPASQITAPTHVSIANATSLTKKTKPSPLPNKHSLLLFGDTLDILIPTRENTTRYIEIPMVLIQGVAAGKKSPAKGRKAKNKQAETNTLTLNIDAAPGKPQTFVNGKREVIANLILLFTNNEDVLLMENHIIRYQGYLRRTIINIKSFRSIASDVPCISHRNRVIALSQISNHVEAHPGEEVVRLDPDLPFDDLGHQERNHTHPLPDLAFKALNTIIHTTSIGESAVENELQKSLPMPGSDNGNIHVAELQSPVEIVRDSIEKANKLVPSEGGTTEESLSLIQPSAELDRTSSPIFKPPLSRGDLEETILDQRENEAEMVAQSSVTDVERPSAGTRSRTKIMREAKSDALAPPALADSQTLMIRTDKKPRAASQSVVSVASNTNLHRVMKAPSELSIQRPVIHDLRDQEVATASQLQILHQFAEDQRPESLAASEVTTPRQDRRGRVSSRELRGISPLTPGKPIVGRTRAAERAAITAVKETRKEVRKALSRKDIPTTKPNKGGYSGRFSKTKLIERPDNTSWSPPGSPYPTRKNDDKIQGNPYSKLQDKHGRKSLLQYGKKHALTTKSNGKSSCKNDVGITTVTKAREDISPKEGKLKNETVLSTSKKMVSKVHSNLPAQIVKAPRQNEIVPTRKPLTRSSAPSEDLGPTHSLIDEAVIGRLSITKSVTGAMQVEVPDEIEESITPATQEQSSPPISLQPPQANQSRKRNCHSKGLGDTTQLESNHPTIKPVLRLSGLLGLTKQEILTSKPVHNPQETTFLEVQDNLEDVSDVTKQLPALLKEQLSSKPKHETPKLDTGALKQQDSSSRLAHKLNNVLAPILSSSPAQKALEQQATFSKMEKGIVDRKAMKRSVETLAPAIETPQVPRAVRTGVEVSHLKSSLIHASPLHAEDTKSKRRKQNLPKQHQSSLRNGRPSQVKLKILNRDELERAEVIRQSQAAGNEVIMVGDEAESNLEEEISPTPDPPTIIQAFNSAGKCKAGTSLEAEATKKATPGPAYSHVQRKVLTPQKDFRNGRQLREGTINDLLIDSDIRKRPIISFSAKGPRNQGVRQSPILEIPNLESQLIDDHGPTLAASRTGMKKRKSPTPASNGIDDGHVPNSPKRPKLGTPTNEDAEMPTFLPQLEISHPKALTLTTSRRRTQSRTVAANGSPLPRPQRNNGSTKVASSSTALLSSLRRLNDAKQIQPVDLHVRFAIPQSMNHPEASTLTNRDELPVLAPSYQVRPYVSIQRPSSYLASAAAPESLSDLPPHSAEPDGDYVNLQTSDTVRPVEPEDPFFQAVPDGVDPDRESRSVGESISSHTRSRFTQLLRSVGRPQMRQQTTLAERNIDASTSILERNVNKRGRPAILRRQNRTLPNTPMNESSSDETSSLDSFGEELQTIQTHKIKVSPRTARYMHWRQNLKPHQENMMEALIDISQRLVQNLVSHETAIDDLIDEFSNGASKIVTRLESTQSREQQNHAVRGRQVGQGLATQLKDVDSMLQKRNEEVGAMSVANLAAKWAELQV
ncbi:hypothetical protein MMC25_003604 [Agyrium rufum]|nr:hypothetical protein [Agyrium rufum]